MSVKANLAALAGAQPDLLAQAPGDLTKQAALGGVLLSTAGIAGFSGFFAVQSTVGLPWWICGLIGLAWAVVVLNLDRFLIVSMSGLRTTKLKLGAALPRLLLALVIGTVISTPLVLRIFQPEINTELAVMHAEGIQEAEGALTQAYARIDELTKEQTRLQGVINGTAVQAVSDDPDVKAATAAYQAAETSYQTLNQAAQCELDGTCGTKRAGVGDSYLEKKAAADGSRQTRDDAKHKLDDITATAVNRLQTGASTARDQAKEQLPRVQKELAALQDRRAQAESAANDAQDSNVGMLARLEALERVTKGHFMAWLAHFMLFLLFVCIELLPVIAKVLSSLGMKPLYERLAEQRDESDFTISRIEEEERLHIAENTARTREAIAKQQLDAQEQAGLSAAEALVDQQKQITMRAIQVWADLARLRADEELQRWYDANIAPAHNGHGPRNGHPITHYGKVVP